MNHQTLEPMEYPSKKSGRNFIRYFGAVALGLAAYGGAQLFEGPNTSISQHAVQVDAPADLCMRKGVDRLMTKFSAASQATKDKAWTEIGFECARENGLPQNVDYDIDPSAKGSRRYLRDYSPSG